MALKKILLEGLGNFLGLDLLAVLGFFILFVPLAAFLLGFLSGDKNDPPSHPPTLGPGHGKGTYTLQCFGKTIFQKKKIG